MLLKITVKSRVVQLGLVTFLSLWENAWRRNFERLVILAHRLEGFRQYSYDGKGAAEQ